MWKINGLRFMTEKEKRIKPCSTMLLNPEWKREHLPVTLARSLFHVPQLVDLKLHITVFHHFQFSLKWSTTAISKFTNLIPRILQLVPDLTVVHTNSQVQGDSSLIAVWCNIWEEAVSFDRGATTHADIEGTSSNRGVKTCQGFLRTDLCRTGNGCRDLKCFQNFSCSWVAGARLPGGQWDSSRGKPRYQ